MDLRFDFHLGKIGETQNLLAFPDGSAFVDLHIAASIARIYDHPVVRRMDVAVRQLQLHPIQPLLFFLFRVDCLVPGSQSLLSQRVIVVAHLLGGLPRSLGGTRRNHLYDRARRYRERDDRVEIVERKTDDFQVVKLHSFYVRYRIPLWTEVQCFEWAEGVSEATLPDA